MNKKQSALDTVKPKLDAILQASLPVQESMSMDIGFKKEQYAAALYLPRPLYVFYRRADAWREACDKSLRLTIEGDIEVARAMANSQQEKVDEENEEGDAEEETG